MEPHAGHAALRAQLLRACVSLERVHLEDKSFTSTEGQILTLENSGHGGAR